MSAHFLAKPILFGVLSGALLSGCLSPNASTGGGNPPPLHLQNPFKTDLSGLSNADRLDSSRKALGLLREKSGNSYRYTTYFRSWSPFWDSTWIEVKQGKVVRRDVVYQPNSDSDPLPPVIRFTETGTGLGAGVFGSLPITLDSLYRECGEYLKSDPAVSETVFEMDGDFILKTCGRLLRGCMDDCGPQIQLSEVRWGERPQPD